MAYECVDGTHQQQICKRFKIINAPPFYKLPYGRPRPVEQRFEGEQETLIYMKNRMGYIMQYARQGEPVYIPFLPALRAEITGICRIAIQAMRFHRAKNNK
jgi:hypothetical protein